MLMAIPHGVLEAIQSPGRPGRRRRRGARATTPPSAQGLAEAAGSAAAAIGAFTAAPLFAALGAGPAWLIAGIVMAVLLATSSLLDRPRFAAPVRVEAGVGPVGREPDALTQPYCSHRHVSPRRAGGSRYGTTRRVRMSGERDGRSERRRTAAVAAPGPLRVAAGARADVRARAGRAARRAGARAAARLDGDRRPQLVRLLRPARRALPRHRPRPPRARAGPALAPSRSASSSAPTTSPRWPGSWASTASCPSATRWAARSPS